MDIKFTIEFYEKQNGECPFLKYVEQQHKKMQDKILAYLYNLSTMQSFRQEPYSRHVRGKLRELKIEFGAKYHRIFYFIVVKRKIIVLHAFAKKARKTPLKEISKALEYMDDYISRYK